MHYLDHAATTPIHVDVQQKIQQVLKEYGNPSSIYEMGRTQKNQLQQVKQAIKKMLHAAPADEIIFTGSGSEANNLVIQSFLHEYAGQECHLITSSIEHPSVLKTMRFAEQMGCEVTYVPVTTDGVIAVETIAKSIKETTRLISIMAVNNETGVKQPIEEIAQLAKEKGVPFHTDAVQAFGHEDIRVDHLLADYITVSGHKMNAPKGIGFLYKRATSHLQPFIIGGGQENGLRAGTENMPYIQGLHVAVERTVQQRATLNEHVKRLGAYLCEQLEKNGIQFEINGDLSRHSPHIWNVWLPQVSASQAIIYCDLAKVFISAGSACSAGSLTPSPVLTAMFGEGDQRVSESLRLSFGESNTTEDIDAFVAAILPLAQKMQTNE